MCGSRKGKGLYKYMAFHQIEIKHIYCVVCLLWPARERECGQTQRRFLSNNISRGVMGPAKTNPPPLRRTDVYLYTNGCVVAFRCYSPNFCLVWFYFLHFSHVCVCVCGLSMCVYCWLSSLLDSSKYNSPARVITKTRAGARLGYF